MDLDVKVKATLIGACFLIVSYLLIYKRPSYNDGHFGYRPLAIGVAWAGLITKASMLVYILEGVSMSTKYTGTVFSSGNTG